MTRLLLLRHAKSSWADPAMEDHERPLAKRGANAAPRMGRYITDAGLVPDVILSSDSVRTHATVALVLPELGPDPPPVLYEAGLYLASPTDILARLHRLKSDVQTAMVVGHNPGLHVLALALTGGGDADALKRLAQKFPTAALAVLTFPGKPWVNAKPGTGVLEAFVGPRDLG
ncbi:MAG: histidine phosphatase family protein [Hyphomicrobiaceae bacterium]|nr:histidine phosphatase family protein [Hyphomicrobiaceae bacterium]